MKLNTATAFLFVMGLWSCGQGHNESTASVNEQSEESSLVLHIDSAEIRNLGIQSTVVHPIKFSAPVKVSGEILPSSVSTYNIVSSGSGTVTFTRDIQPGVEVSRGAIIAKVNHTNVSGASTEMAAAADVASARREYERVKALLAEGLATQSELNAALGAYEKAKAAHNPAALSPNLSSPISGIINSVNVANGQYVDAGTTIATVVEPGMVSVAAQLPESYLNKISGPISSILIKTIRLSEPIAIELPNPVDISRTPANKGYIPLTFTFANPGTLTTGTTADIYLVSDNSSESIAIPRSAIMESQGTYFVYVVTEPNHFEQRIIQPGEYNGLVTAIQQGINDGDEVVTEGAAMVRLKQNRNQPMEGHHHH